MTTRQRNIALTDALWSTLLALTVALLAGSASAEAPRVHLSWSHPVGSMCPSGATLQRDVEELMGDRMFVPREEADMLVEGGVEELPSAVVARIEVRSAEGTMLGTRELSAPAGECASLRRVLALVLAMLLDVPTEGTERLRHRANVLRFGASLGLLSGALPRVTPGVGLAFALDHRARLRLRVDATYWFPVGVETSQGLGAKIQAFGLSSVLCPRLTPDATRVAVWLCAGAELGALHAAPRRLDNPSRNSVRLLAQAELEAVVSLRVRPAYELWLGCGLVAALSRPRFYFSRSDGSRRQVHRPAGIGMIFRLGLTIGGS